MPAIDGRVLRRRHHHELFVDHPHSGMRRDPESNSHSDGISVAGTNQKTVTVSISRTDAVTEHAKTVGNTDHFAISSAHTKSDQITFQFPVENPHKKCV